MKKIFVAVLLSVTSVLFADFKNQDEKNMQKEFSFELARKISNQAGFFIACWTQSIVVESYVSNALSRRGGGRPAVRRERKNSDGRSTNTIIIVGCDLSDMADGNKIPLRYNQTLYKIGTHTTKIGRTYEVYSFERNDKPETFLNPEKPQSQQKPTQRSLPQAINCPHCGNLIMVIKAR